VRVFIELVPSGDENLVGLRGGRRLPLGAVQVVVRAIDYRDRLSRKAAQIDAVPWLSVPGLAESPPSLWAQLFFLPEKATEKSGSLAAGVGVLDDIAERASDVGAQPVQ
jgi:hypothetical protein